MNSRKEVFVDCISRSAQVITELGGNEINEVKADPDKDDENRRTLNSSLLAASPYRMMNLLICSIVDVSSCLEN